jgi:hypothetical protein
MGMITAMLMAVRVPHKRRALRLGAIAVLWALLAAWIVTFSLSLAVQRLNPAVALKLHPWNATAAGSLAWQEAARQDRRADWRRVRALAESALRADPTSVAALRSLGLAAAAQNDERKAQRLIAASEALSRRDLASQIWLIEARVAANDVVGALRHYDRALRTSLAAQPILMPILVEAANDPAILAELERLLRRDPDWRRSFMLPFIERNANPTYTATLVARIGNADESTAAVKKLAADGHFDQARQVLVARGVRPGDPDAELAFDRESRFPPFDWEWTTEPSVTVDRFNQPKQIIQVSAEPATQSRTVVRKVVRLLPGATYRLQAYASLSDDTEQSWTIRCARGGGLVARAELSRGTRTVLARGRVPDRCDWGYLALELERFASPDELRFTTGRLALTTER